MQAIFNQEKDTLEQKILSLQNQIKELNDELEQKEQTIVHLKQSATTNTTAPQTTLTSEQQLQQPTSPRQSSSLGLSWLGFIGGSQQPNETPDRENSTQLTTKENTRLKKLLNEKNTNFLSLQNENSVLSKENTKLKAETLKLKQYIKKQQSINQSKPQTSSVQSQKQEQHQQQQEQQQTESSVS